MYVTNTTKFNTTNDYDDITSSNYTDILNHYNKSSLSSCTDSEFNIDIIIPSSLLRTQCGLPFLCLIFFLVFILIKI